MTGSFRAAFVLAEGFLSLLVEELLPSKVEVDSEEPPACTFDGSLDVDVLDAACAARMLLVSLEDWKMAFETPDASLCWLWLLVLLPPLGLELFSSELPEEDDGDSVLRLCAARKFSMSSCALCTGVAISLHVVANDIHTDNASRLVVDGLLSRRNVHTLKRPG